MEKLRATEHHYIRCLKPNQTLKAGDWDNDFMFKQLAYSGTLEVTQIRKAGLNVRRPLKHFYQYYKVCAEDPTALKAGTVTKRTELLLKQLGIDENQYRVGKTNWVTPQTPHLTPISPYSGVQHRVHRLPLPRRRQGPHVRGAGEPHGCEHDGREHDQRRPHLGLRHDADVQASVVRARRPAHRQQHVRRLHRDAPPARLRGLPDRHRADAAPCEAAVLLRLEAAREVEHQRVVRQAHPAEARAHANGDGSAVHHPPRPVPRVPHAVRRQVRGDLPDVLQRDPVPLPGRHRLLLARAVGRPLQPPPPRGAAAADGPLAHGGDGDVLVPAVDRPAPRSGDRLLHPTRGAPRLEGLLQPHRRRDRRQVGAATHPRPHRTPPARHPSPRFSSHQKSILLTDGRSGAVR